MEREIKFRAKTLDGELIYFELHESNLSGDSEVFYVNGIPCESGTEQQFTGLKDKNGKEIYEGDVVKSDVYASIRKEVVRWDYEHWHPFEYYHSCIERDFEIIGNIHENPGLIND